MGLGKTIQSIAILAQIESDKTPQQRRMRKTFHIVIVPKVTLGKWRQEIAEWAPALRVLCFYGSKEEREDQVRQLREQQTYDVVLTTFEMVIREKTELCRLKFEFLILDEAQRIKNDQSVLSKILRKFMASHRVLLTGTPLQNNLTELWSLLNFLMPRLFDSAEEFQELFQIDLLEGQDQAEQQSKVVK
jgi:SNF2 family DNA or RNA helicase